MLPSFEHKRRAGDKLREGKEGESKYEVRSGREYETGKKSKFKVA
jgi:hypothetical protein